MMLNGRARRVLFLTHRLPYPLIGGDRVKSYHLLRHLSSIGTVDLISLDEAGTLSEASLEHLGQFANIEAIRFNKIKAALRITRALPGSRPIEFSYYDSPEMQRAVRAALAREHYDLIVCFFLRTAHYVTHVTDIPRILIAEDARVLLQERSIARFSLSPEYAVRRLDAHRLKTYEPELMSRGFKRVTFVAREDEARIKSTRPEIPTAILTNGVDIERFGFGASPRENAIVFSGHLGIYHNRLMVERLVTRLFPSIRERSPDTILKIVGSHASADMKRLIAAAPGAQLIENVPAMAPYLQRASVFLHPQEVGAGIQNKLLEAMAAGVAVVTTPVGAAGIAGLESGQHAVVGSTDEALIEATLRLLDDAGERTRLATAARTLIEARYTWPRIFNDFDAIIAEAAPEFFGSAAALTSERLGNLETLNRELIHV